MSTQPPGSLELTPNTLLANAYLGLKDHRQALYFARLGVSQAPNIVTPHSAVSAACVGLGQLAQAAEAMTQAVRVGPEFLHKRLRLLESGQALNESTRSRLHLTLTAMRLVDRTLMSEPLREVLGRLDGLQLPHLGP